MYFMLYIIWYHMQIYFYDVENTYVLTERYICTSIHTRVLYLQCPALNRSLIPP